MRSTAKIILMLSAVSLAGCSVAAKTQPQATPLAIAVKALRDQDPAAMANAQVLADAEVTRAQAAAPNDPCAPAVRKATSVDAAVQKLSLPNMTALPDVARYLVAANYVNDPFLGVGDATASGACPVRRDGGPAAAVDLVQQLAQSKAALDEVAAWRAEVRAGYGSESTFRLNLAQTEKLLRDDGVQVSTRFADGPRTTINVDAMPGWARVVMAGAGHG